jgi:hypothetical protein
MTTRNQSGAHPVGNDHKRANPMGAYVATLGALILFVSMWFDWVGLGPQDEEANFSSGYEADSLIPFMGLLGIGFAAALLYALKRADRNQHRGLSLASFAVGLASLLWIVFFFIDPIETVKYAGYQGEEDPNVTTSWGLWIGALGALLWTVGSFLLAKEPEGDVEHNTTIRRDVPVQHVSHDTHPTTVHEPGHTTTGTTGSYGTTGTTGTTGAYGTPGTGRTGI